MKKIYTFIKVGHAVWSTADYIKLDLQPRSTSFEKTIGSVLLLLIVIILFVI